MNIKNIFSFGAQKPISTNKVQVEKNLNKSVIPIQLNRIKQDTLTWREGVEEAERAYFPFRVKMQQLFIDTVLNLHVKACIEMRKDLTLLRKFEFITASGSIDEKLTTELNKKWFNRFLNLSLDALFYGYSLISLGDLIDNDFKDIEVIKRWNVSPDRLVVASTSYNSVGIDFLSPPYNDFHIYVTTPNDIGTSPCGYGLLYDVGLSEIFLRNILGYNADFVELFSQPFRIGKTDKTEESERNLFEQSVREMGSSGYAILDSMGSESIEFLTAQNSGNGFLGYENFEKRLENKISKLILGHADALDSTAGKLGGSQGGLESPSAQALENKKNKDAVFLCNIVNSDLIPKLIKLGFNIPRDTKFQFKNDSETQYNNIKITELSVEIKKAGLQVDKDYFEKETGIKLSDPMIASPLRPIITNSLKSLNELYRKANK